MKNTRYCGLMLAIAFLPQANAIDVPLFVNTNDVVFTNAAQRSFVLPASPGGTVTPVSPSLASSFSATDDTTPYLPPDRWALWDVST